MPNDHQRPASPDERAVASVRAPSHAERCRTLVSRARSATLSTIAREPAGFPYGSLVTVAIDPQGRPLFLLSTLAEHTGNLKAQADTSALISEPLDSHSEPLALGRVTLLGKTTIVDDTEKASVKETFLAQQPSASYYVDFGDFAFYRLEPIALRYVGGFGRMSWVTADDYRIAEPDPLAPSASGILTHMNEDHANAVHGYARLLAGITDATSATLTAVDRYGFELAATTPSGPRAGRVAFDHPVSTNDEVRRAMIALIGRVRAAES